MTDAERRQLFDPFFTTKEGGTGPRARDRLRHRRAERRHDRGRVRSRPRARRSASSCRPSGRPLDARARRRRGLRPPTGEETILLVEDELVVRRLVAEILESNGYSVLQAGDGPSALELLRRHTGPLDLLVTDVVMPGMSGPEVAGAVAAMRPGTQVLYISGYTDSSIGHHGVLEPGIAFLQKPFDARRPDAQGARGARRRDSTRSRLASRDPVPAEPGSGPVSRGAAAAPPRERATSAATSSGRRYRSSATRSR